MNIFPNAWKYFYVCLDQCLLSRAVIGFQSFKVLTLSYMFLGKQYLLMLSIFLVLLQSSRSSGAPENFGATCVYRRNSSPNTSQGMISRS